MVNHRGKWFVDSTVLDVYYFVWKENKSELLGFLQLSYVVIQPNQQTLVRSQRAMKDDLWVNPIKDSNLLEILKQKAIRGILNNADIRL